MGSRSRSTGWGRPMLRAPGSAAASHPARSSTRPRSSRRPRARPMTSTHHRHPDRGPSLHSLALALAWPSSLPGPHPRCRLLPSSRRSQPPRRRPSARATTTS
eukprot:3290648-Prymnesium_polylepis.1